MADGQVLNNSHLSFVSCLWGVKPESSVDYVKTLWSTIVFSFFRPDSYNLKIKALGLSDNTTAPDAVIIEIRKVERAAPGEPSELHEELVFVVECKQPSCDTVEEWSDGGAPVQLKQYLEQTILEPKNRVLAALAIGIKVEFYQWHRQASPSLQPLHEGVIDLGRPIERQTCEHWIRHARDNGWNWACQP